MTLSELQSIPNVGPAIARKLERLDIVRVEDLRGQDGEDLFERLCALDALPPRPVPAGHVRRRRRLRQRRAAAAVVGVQPRAQGARPWLTSADRCCWAG